MASCARREIVRPGQSGIFHCWSRCVRRAFLLGQDPLTGRNHDHRRGWVYERLELLAANFVIDVAFTGVMSNHLHLVLRTNPRLIHRMGAWEIARRWLRVFPGRRVLDGNWIEPTDEQVRALAEDQDRIEELRKRLCDISCFMGALSEYVARRANREDQCDGRFWAGRFGCKELVSEGALLLCGIYVELNQIRAGEARTPEESTHSSVWYRIQARRQLAQLGETPRPVCDGWLAPLTLEPDQLGDVPSVTGRRASDKGLLTLSLEEFLRILDGCGRQLAPGKRGSIPEDLAPILQRLGLEPSKFLEALDHYATRFPRLAGPVAALQARAQEIGRRWLQGVRTAAKVFCPSA